MFRASACLMIGKSCARSIIALRSAARLHFDIILGLESCGNSLFNTLVNLTGECIVVEHLS
jgi:hypothetical protein